jgi:hypothetical protein
MRVPDHTDGSATVDITFTGVTSTPSMRGTTSSRRLRLAAGASSRRQQHRHSSPCRPRNARGHPVRPLAAPWIHRRALSPDRPRHGHGLD